MANGVPPGRVVNLTQPKNDLVLVQFILVANPTFAMIKKALMIWASVTLALSASAQTTPTVTSNLVSVTNRKYTVYDYAEPGKEYCVVIPEGLKTVRGLVVE